MIVKNSITKDLLTENRYWTFWSSDWSKRINVYWEGKTKFSNICNALKIKLGKDLTYERSVEIQEPDIQFS